MSTKILFIAILLLGFVLRVLDINNNPPALYGDELTIALDSNSILKTGHDQLGNFLPLTFPMGAGRPAGYVYGSVPFISIFGPTPLGVRSLSILSGMGILLLLYLLGKKLFSLNVGLSAALITTVSPWDISLSRAGFEAHFALLLALLGIWFFLSESKKPIFYILSAIFFGITLHTYPTYKLIFLLFIPLIVWFIGGIRNLWTDKSRKMILSSSLIFLMLVILALIQTLKAGSETRFKEINIFTQKELLENITQKINYERSTTNLPSSVAQYFHNKPLEYSKVLIENYFQNFSIDFLFLHGDRNPRHNMATMGEIYLAQIILLFSGVVMLWQKERRKPIFLLIWLLVAPLGSSIISNPHALRSAFMLPPLILLSSYGLANLISFKQRIILILVGIIFVVQFIFFIQKLYFLSPKEYGRFWSYSAKLGSDIAIANRQKYDFVILSDRIDDVEFAYPVYAKIDPLAVIAQNKQRTLLDKYQFKRFDNIYIGYIPDGDTQNFLRNLSGSVLYIGEPDMKNQLTDYETVQDKDGSPALIIQNRVSRF